MRAAVFLGLVTLALAATEPSAPAGGPATRTVTCAESIDRTVFPYVGSRARAHRYRTVLDAVSLPPAFLQAYHHPEAADWPYFAKSGVVVRATRQTVTLTVPRAFRSRVAIAWGNAGNVYATVRFVGCSPSDPRAGNAYAGGFSLRSSSACVPLLVRAGGRTATVRFGLGRRC